MTPVLENTTHALTFLGNVSHKPGSVMNRYQKRVLTLRGVIGLLVCFLAGVAAAVILLYTLF